MSRFQSSAPSLCAVADGASLHVDRRLTWGETKESALRDVRRACGRDASVRVTTYDSRSYTGKRYPVEAYYPTWRIPEDHPVVLGGVETFHRLFGDGARVVSRRSSTNGVSICGRYTISHPWVRSRGRDVLPRTQRGDTHRPPGTRRRVLRFVAVCDGGTHVRFETITGTSLGTTMMLRKGDQA